jgi:RNA polymerase sigma-70 factor (ECF subfamily)
MDDDFQTIRRVLAGDIDSFRLLVERHQGALFSLVSNLVRDVTDRDDIAQETFLAAYLHLGSYDPQRGKFSTWLLTIARNKCFNAMKERRPLAMEPLPPKVDRRSPADRLLETELAIQFDRALAALPFEQKTAFILSEIEGLSHDEICQIEEVPLGTVKSRISRAKEKLRSFLSCLPETH